MTSREVQTARALLKIRAVFFRPDEPFIWASGIKSPVYCDNRLILTAPEVRAEVERGIAEIISEYYPDAEVLMGTSTVRRTTAERIRSKGGWSRARRSWSWKT